MSPKSCEIARSSSIAQLEVPTSTRGARGGRWERSEGVNGDRSSHFKHICCDGSAPTCWVDPASVATTHSSLSVPCHRSLSLITPLLHVARRCACYNVNVHNLPCFLGEQYVTRLAPSLRRSLSQLVPARLRTPSVTAPHSGANGQGLISGSACQVCT